MQFCHLIVGQIHHLIAITVQLIDDFQPLGMASGQADTDEDAGIVSIGIAVVKLGDRTAAQQLAELQEAALLLWNGYCQ
ncbi:hypothetical protein D3C78_1905390 [compost metagenome]